MMSTDGELRLVMVNDVEWWWITSSDGELRLVMVNYVYTDGELRLVMVNDV